jgi:hypothetical protein
MPSYAALFYADSHLRQRRGDEQYAMRQVVDLAVKFKVRNVVAGGDLHDKQSNRPGPVNFMHREILDRLEEAGVEYNFIQGQHDYDVPPWPLGHRWAVHVHKKTFLVGPHVAYGLDFQPYGLLQASLEAVPKECTLLIAHQTWGDWMGDIASPQGDFAQVPGHVTHVLSGDLHKFVMETNRNADGASMLTVSPGATCKQKIDEPDEHFVVLVPDDPDCGLKRVKLKSRAHIEWATLNRPEDLDQMIAEVGGELDRAHRRGEELGLPDDVLRPTLRVTYSHRLKDAVRRVTRAVGDRAWLHWKELPPEERQAVAVAKGGRAVTPLALLSEVELPEPAEEVRGLLSRLLESGVGFRDEFQRWKAEQMKD